MLRCGRIVFPAVIQRTSTQRRSRQGARARAGFEQAGRGRTDDDDRLGPLQAVHVRSERVVPLLCPEAQPPQSVSRVGSVHVHDVDPIELGGDDPSFSIALRLTDAASDLEKLWTRTGSRSSNKRREFLVVWIVRSRYAFCR